jgi:type VI secretion system protein ImpA
VNTRAPQLEPEASTADGDAAEPSDAHGSVAAVSSVQPSGPASDITSFSDVSAALQAAIDYYAAQEPSSPALLLLRQAHQLIGISFLDAMKILAPAIADKAKISIGGETPFSLSFAHLSSFAGGSAQNGTETAEARTYAAANRAEAVNLMRKVEQFYLQTEPSSPIPLLVERARTLVSKNFTELLKEMSKKDEPPAKGEKGDKN